MAKTFKQIMDEARNEVREVSVQEANEIVQKNGRHVLLDVREKDEYREGHLQGAVSLPRGFLEIKPLEYMLDCLCLHFLTESTVLGHGRPDNSIVRVGCDLLRRCPEGQLEVASPSARPTAQLD